jgi:hypothetical protein
VQQKDELCGPFCTARVLVELGVTEWDGEPVDQDLVALRAGTTLPSDELPNVPPGERSWRDYERPIELADIDVAGTTAEALVDAVEVAGGGALAAVPVRGEWTPAAVELLVAAAESTGARLIANIRSGRLWGSRPPVDALIGHLAGRPVDQPPPDWDVGHFCELRALVRGVRGSLVVVRDTYPGLGYDGHHLQPPHALAAALLRGDGREGGVLAIVAAERRGALEAEVAGAGLAVGIWDNGTRR